MPGGKITFRVKRRRGFTLIAGIDGVRYAIRHNVLAAIPGTDECSNETLALLDGGRPGA
jgi:hypothetical protein